MPTEVQAQLAKLFADLYDGISRRRNDFELTDKRLVVTAGTNGQHAPGEHSHAVGWKVDVNDFGFGEDGALTTPDGGKGCFTDEFIAYGRSLGLGMNWEGDHIDVALDGTQWNGNGEQAGGFNPRRRETPRRSTPQPQQNQQPPQVDINDETTRNLFARFAEERRNTSSGEQAAEDELFFAPMFRSDTFQNTAENHAAILDNFGDEFRAWINAQQDSPARATRKTSTR